MTIKKMFPNHIFTLLLLFVAPVTNASARKASAMVAPKVIRVDTTEISARTLNEGPAVEVQAEELVARSIAPSSKGKTVWSYRPTTLPNQMQYSTKVGEWQPVCLRFVDLKVDGKILIATYHQGFIQANEYGVTDAKKPFASYREWVARIDVVSGKEISIQETVKK